ncbi:hypothetical protein JAO78_016220 [Alishewanella sp. 16-MA]|uniref:Uncharacterized protein n=1 Tax=Alishewanella maricola TaxID=2795740 RepID=A0ABS8C7U4_9ALTE|nr:hypothetical protein [Alishewanella maricola]MCB5228352.1 hypothetical protein [Alishewanella maricola]
MPRKLTFKNQDLSFLNRYLLRIKSDDNTLKLNAQKLKQLKQAFYDLPPFKSYPTSLSEKNIVNKRLLERANSDLVKLLDATERERLSKARYAFKLKESEKNYSLDVTPTTHNCLAQITKCCKKFASEKNIDVKITAKSLLEIILLNVHFQVVVEKNVEEGISSLLDDYLVKTAQKRDEYDD